MRLLKPLRRKEPVYVNIKKFDIISKEVITN